MLFDMVSKPFNWLDDFSIFLEEGAGTSYGRPLSSVDVTNTLEMSVDSCPRELIQCSITGKTTTFEEKDRNSEQNLGLHMETQKLSNLQIN